MNSSVHYLRLAYLAEIAIVFNLAYIELKWKEVIKEIKGKMAPGVALVPSVIEKLPCQKKKCNKCYNLDTLSPISDKYSENYLSKIATALYAELPDNREEQNHQPDRKSLYNAWSFAQCKSRYILWLFHVMIRAEIDRALSVIFLGATIIILILQTMADAYLV